MDIGIKRVYETPSKNDGYRILVDRLWPRGIKKENAALDEWNKLLPPSTELRKWFAHKPENFTEFTHKYTLELTQNKEELKRIKEIALHKKVTLVYSAKDPKINHAVVLLTVIKHTRI